MEGVKCALQADDNRVYSIFSFAGKLSDLSKVFLFSKPECDMSCQACVENKSTNFSTTS